MLTDERKFDTQSPVFVLVGGKSGVGKTTFVNFLIENYSKHFGRPKSYTSRKPRDDTDHQEYIFTSKERIRQLHKEGRLINLDEVYGELYGIERPRSEKRRPIFLIKEVHPENHQSIIDAVPNTITVLLDSRANIRSNGENRDDTFYASLEKTRFDIVLYREHFSGLSSMAESLFNAINAYSYTCHLYPPALQIDDTNSLGYTKAAHQFTDDLRLTTKNFHDLTATYFVTSFNEIKNGSEKPLRCLEIGPGRGWFKSLIDLDGVDYESVEIAKPMIMLSEKNWNNEKTVPGSARSLPFDSESFDLIVGSLADPFFYPLAVCEIRRVMRLGGKAIFSLPSRQWSNGLRPEDKKNMTHFQLTDGEVCEVFSFSYSLAEVKRLLDICGYVSVDCLEITGESLSEDELSPAIIASTLNNKVSKDELPIMNFITACRGRNL